MSKEKTDTNPKERENNGRCQRYSWFSVVLYPDCDTNHNLLMETMIENPQLYQHLVWIDHDRDLYIDDIEDHKKGEVKKKHRHVLFRHPRQSTENSVIAEFCGVVNVVQGVFSPEATLTYYLHKTFKAKLEGKVPYDESELQGDISFALHVLAQNTNFIQLRDIVQIVINSRSGSMAELLLTISEMPSDAQESFYNVIKQNQSIICAMTNQQTRICSKRLIAYEHWEHSYKRNNKLS